MKLVDVDSGSLLGAAATEALLPRKGTMRYYSRSLMRRYFPDAVNTGGTL